MKTPMNAEVKARVDEQLKLHLSLIAHARRLDLSDLVREALSELVARQLPTVPALQR